EGPSHRLKVPIRESDLPNVHARVYLVGSMPVASDTNPAADSPLNRPAFASGAYNLSISTATRTLSVKVTPRATALEPGGKTVIDIEVRDHASRPVAGGELAVVVVDEAILALTQYRLTDPIKTFYVDRSDTMRAHYLRDSVTLRRAGMFAVAYKRVGVGAGTGIGVGSSVFRVRTDFNPLATFAASVLTDANGR